MEEIGVFCGGEERKLLKDKSLLLTRIKKLKQQLKYLEAGLKVGWRVTTAMLTLTALVGYILGDYIASLARYIPFSSNNAIGAVTLIITYLLCIKIYHFAWLARLHYNLFGEGKNKTDKEQERINKEIQAIEPIDGDNKQWVELDKIVQILAYEGDKRNLGVILKHNKNIQKRRTSTGNLYCIRSKK